MYLLILSIAHNVVFMTNLNDNAMRCHVTKGQVTVVCLSPAFNQVDQYINTVITCRTWSTRPGRPPVAAADGPNIDKARGSSEQTQGLFTAAMTTSPPQTGTPCINDLHNPVSLPLQRLFVFLIYPRSMYIVKNKCYLAV